jgi:hypothetical protein
MRPISFVIVGYDAFFDAHRLNQKLAGIQGRIVMADGSLPRGLRETMIM